jgi:hypothetical protein
LKYRKCLRYRQKTFVCDVNFPAYTFRAKIHPHALYNGGNRMTNFLSYHGTITMISYFFIGQNGEKEGCYQLMGHGDRFVVPFSLFHRDKEPVPLSQLTLTKHFLSFHSVFVVESKIKNPKRKILLKFKK